MRKCVCELNIFFVVAGGGVPTTGDCVLARYTFHVISVLQAVCVHIDCPYQACVTFCRFTKSKHLPRHIGQHCPGGGGSEFGQEGRAHSTSLQSRVGRTVGSGGFVGGGLGPVCIIMVRLLSEFEYVHATYLPTWTCWAA